MKLPILTLRLIVRAASMIAFSTAVASATEDSQCRDHLIGTPQNNNYSKQETSEDSTMNFILESLSADDSTNKDLNGPTYRKLDQLAVDYQNAPPHMKNIKFSALYKEMYGLIVKEARAIAYRTGSINSNSLEVNDLIQEASFPILRALDTYKISEGAFTTYTVQPIRWHLLRHQLQAGKIISMPLHVIKFVNSVTRELQTLEAHWGRRLTLNEQREVLVSNNEGQSYKNILKNNEFKKILKNASNKKKLSEEDVQTLALSFIISKKIIMNTSSLNDPLYSSSDDSQTELGDTLADQNTTDALSERQSDQQFEIVKLALTIIAKDLGEEAVELFTFKNFSAFTDNSGKFIVGNGSYPHALNEKQIQKGEVEMSDLAIMYGLSRNKATNIYYLVQKRLAAELKYKTSETNIHFRKKDLTQEPTAATQTSDINALTDPEALLEITPQLETSLEEKLQEEQTIKINLVKQPFIKPVNTQDTIQTKVMTKQLQPNANIKEPSNWDTILKSRYKRKK